MDCSTPGFPVHHQFLEPAQTHVHQVSDAIQPSHPLSSPSPPAFNLCQNQCWCWQELMQRAALHIRCPKYWSFSFTSVLPMNIQDWFPLGLTGLISRSPRDSQESSPILQFKSINSLALSFLYDPTLTSIHDTEKTIALIIQTFVGKVMSLLLIYYLGWS